MGKRRMFPRVLKLNQISKLELLQILEIALAHYSVAYRDAWTPTKLLYANMSMGLCYYLKNQLNLDIEALMNNVISDYWSKIPGERGHSNFVLYYMPCSEKLDRKGRIKALYIRVLFLQALIKELRRTA